MTRTLQIAAGDWVLDRRTGRPVLVGERTKLLQDVAECLTVEVLASGFGAGLEDIVGLDVDPAGFRIEVRRAVRDSMVTLQRLQDQFLVAERSGAERIAGIVSVTVGATNLGGGTAKTGYAFTLRLRPVAGDTVTVTVAGG